MSNSKLYPPNHSTSRMTPIEESHIATRLSMQYLPNVTETELDGAKARVFQRIVSSKHKLHKTMTQDHTQKKVIGKRNFFLLPIVSLATLAIIAGGGYYLYQSKANTSVATTSTSSVNYKKLTLAQKAKARFEELTNGLSSTSVAKVENNLAKNASPLASTNKIAADSSIALPFVGDKNKLNDTITYRNYETEVLEDLSGENTTYLLQVNTKKGDKVSEKSWITGLFSINLLASSSGAIIYDEYAQDYSLSYRGGKYAVKTEYKRPENLSQEIFLNNGLVQDFELGFLEAILKDNGQSFTKLPDETINSKKVLVFEDKPIDFEKIDSSSQLNPNALPNYTLPKTRFFVDEENLQFVKRESFLDGKKLLKSTLLETKKITGNDAKTFISSNNINDLTSKKIDVKTEVISAEGFITSQMDKISNKYTLLVPANNQKFTRLSGFDSDRYNSGSLSLTQTIDFDPNYQPFPETQPFVIPVSTYSNYSIYGSSSNTQELTIDIYKQNPIITETEFPGGENEKVLSDLTVTVNGEKVAAQIIGYTDPISEKAVVVKYKDLWYRFSSYNSTNDSSFSLTTIFSNLRTLTSNEAIESDNFFDNQNTYSPNIYGGQLSKENGDSLLPGDLAQQNFYPNYVSVNGKKRADCTKLEEISNFDIESCVLAQINGTMISYTDQKPQEATIPFIDLNSFIAPTSELSKVKTFNWIYGDKEPFFYINTDSKLRNISVKIKDLANSIKVWEYTLTDPSSTGNNVTDNVIKTFYTKKIADKYAIVSTLTDSYGLTLNEEQAVAVLEKAAINKDFDIIKSQIEKASQLYGPINPAGLKGGSYQFGG